MDTGDKSDHSLLELNDTNSNRSVMLVQIGALNIVSDEENTKDQFLLYFYDTSFIVTDRSGNVLGTFQLTVTNKDTDHIKLLVLDSEFKKQTKDIAMLSLFLGSKEHIEVEQFFISYKKGRINVYDSSENILGSVDLIRKKKIITLEFVPNNLVIAQKR